LDTLGSTTKPAAVGRPGAENALVDFHGTVAPHFDQSDRAIAGKHARLL
jgi:hypothetical protein